MYAYYILHKLHRFPSEWMSLPQAEQAAIFALIEEKTRRDKKEAARARLRGERRR